MCTIENIHYVLRTDFSFSYAPVSMSNNSLLSEMVIYWKTSIQKEFQFAENYYPFRSITIIFLQVSTSRFVQSEFVRKKNHIRCSLLSELFQPNKFHFGSIIWIFIWRTFSLVSVITLPIQKLSEEHYQYQILKLK